jgi:calcineurin-like phosphoesterase
LTDDNPVTEEDTSMSNAEIGLYQCKICKDVTDSFKDFFQHYQNGCSLWKFLSPINKQNTSMNEGNIPKTKEGKSSRNKAKKRTLIKDRNENGKVKISKMSKEVDDTFLPEENSSMIDDKSSEEKNLFINFHAWKPKCTNKIKSVGAI